MKRLIIVGSPRTNGRSAHLAEMLFEANIDEHPEDELFLVPVSEVEIGPCIGCDACRAKSSVILKGDDGHEVTVQKHRCVFDDDMQTVYDLLDDVDEVVAVTPVYFSGAPAPFKCVLDRLQPYFWARVEAREAGPLPEKRPLTLHVIGEGGDPYGYGALLSEVRSAFSMADFRLERVLDWVGKIDESGEITADAAEVAVPPLAVAAQPEEPQTEPPVKPRPKLDLHSGIRDEPADKAGAHQAKAEGKPQSAQGRSGQGKGKPRSAQGSAQGGSRQGSRKSSAGSGKGATGSGKGKGKRRGR